MFRISHLAIISLSACGIVLTQLYPFCPFIRSQNFQAKVDADVAGPRAPDNPSGGKDRPLPLVRVREITLHGDMDCFKVETPSATYIYGKKGAGFTSILDQGGRDWISYRPGDKA